MPGAGRLRLFSIRFRRGQCVQVFIMTDRQHSEDGRIMSMERSGHMKIQLGDG